MSSKPQRMDDAEYSDVIAGLFADAQDYYENEIEPEQLAASKMYNGDPFGNEEEGRSSFVMRVAADVVQQMLPSMLRTFDGPEQVMEVEPWDELEVETAREQADAVNYIFKTKNNGFRILFDAFKDALIRKTGCLTWEADVITRKMPVTYRGWDGDMVSSLEDDDTFTIVSKTLEEDDDLPTAAQADPNQPDLDPSIMRAMGVDQPDTRPEILKTYTVKAMRTIKEPVFRVSCFPPEQLRINRGARNEDDALLIGRCREDIRISDLVSMGYDYDEVIENAGATPSRVNSSSLADYRQPDNSLGGSFEATTDPSHQMVMFGQYFVRVDRDGDGIAELRRVRTLGQTHYILDDEVFEDETPPIAILCPDPEPHAAIGRSIVDAVADLQAQKTSILRDISDSLANSIHPRTVVDEMKVNLDDAQGLEIGQIIRTKGQPSAAVMELTKTYIGAEGLALLGYFDQVQATRTGLTMGSQGLNGDEMQSTTAIGISAQLSAAQERLEMVARIFAETGLKRMYRGILRMLIRHSVEPLPIRTRDGTFKKVDPATWNADAEWVVRTGLGKGSDAQRLAAYQQVLQFQTQAITQFGLNQPVVGVAEIRNTLEDMMNCAGIKAVTRHFKQVPEGWQPPQPPQPVDPNAIMMAQAQAQQVKSQADLKKVDLDHELEREKLRLEFHFKAEQLAQDRELKLAEIEAKYAFQANQAQIEADIKREGMIADAYLAQATAAPAAPAPAPQPAPAPEGPPLV